MNKTPSTIDIEIMNKFNHIHIADSSSWKIPQPLKQAFKGYNQAGCKTQLTIDYKTGCMHQLDITPEAYNDQNYSKTMDDFIEENDLMIFDLAYAITETLNNIAKKDSYFLCRLNTSGINVYLKEHSGYREVDTLSILNNLKKHKAIHEIHCYVGNKNHKIKVRLLVIAVPEETANRRRQKLRQNSIAKGRTPSKRNLQLCNWTLYITNIPQDKNLDVRNIAALYSIRWTIEIFFKQLKSILNIHKTYVKRNPYRLECEILARCIVAMFIAYCYSSARSYLWVNRKCEISFEKTVKYFKRNITIFLNKLFTSIRKAIDLLKIMILKIIDTCQKHRQQTRINSLDQLSGKSLYSNLKYIKISQARLLAMTS